MNSILDIKTADRSRFTKMFS